MDESWKFTCESEHKLNNFKDINKVEKNLSNVNPKKIKF